MPDRTKPFTFGLEPGHRRRLERLAAAALERDVPLCADPVHGPLTWLIEGLLVSLDDAIMRPGSWERSAFAPLFTDEALDAAMAAIYEAGEEPN